MKRRTLLAGIASLSGCAIDRRPRLNVYTWSSYLAASTIPDFEAEFGVHVRVGIYESVEEMLAKAMTGNSGWDIVFPSANFIFPMREMGLLARINHSAIHNLDKLAPRFRAPAWDRQLEWSVPYMTGTTGIIYHKAVQPAPIAWADLWDRRLGGRMTMLDDPPEVIGAALKKLGYSLNSTDPAELDRAKREATVQKPLVRAYLNIEARDQLVAGDIAAAQGWATTAAQAIAANSALAFSFPREGFPMYTDCAVILRESRRAELAHRFIDYMLRPAVNAAVAIESRTATCNHAALALLPPEVRDDPVLYPSDNVLARGEWFEPMPASAQRLRDRIWTEIKSS
jgi:spermidine/putrescine transport system substrate-binding protein